MLLAVSRVHETVPLFLVEGLKRRLGGSLRDRKVAVLGLTFKRDTDDLRDSLSLKLIRLLERELATSRATTRTCPTSRSRSRRRSPGADAVIIATNHSSFEGVLRPIPDERSLLVDPWNVTGAGAGVRLRARAGGACAAR